MLWQLLLGCLAAATAVLSDTDPIVVKGSKLVYSSTGDQFFLKGLQYSISNPSRDRDHNSDTDPLANPTACARDIPLFKSLGINTIGVYTVNSAANHDECMRLLGDAGIYVITYLNPLNGLASGNVTWTTEDFTAQTTIIDAFAGFDNVLAFFVQIGDSGPTTGVNTAVDDTARTGNELLSAYARAVVRDMKAYIASRVNQRGKDAETGYRQVPVGYAAYATDLLDDEVTFFTCGYKEERVDIFGIRSESWCGGSGFRSSGWENLTNRFEDSNVPVVMAEYYCGDPDRRDEDLNDVDKLYDEDMVEVWSGGMFYTYAGQDYGLVEIDDYGEVTKSSAFDTFSSILSSSNPSPTNLISSSGGITLCPMVNPFYPGPPPQPDRQYCDCTLRSSLCAPLSNTPATFDALYEDICANSNDLCIFRPNDNSWQQYGDYSMCNASVEIAALLSQYTVEMLGWDSENCMLKWGSNVGPNPLYGTQPRVRGPPRCIQRAIGEESEEIEEEEEEEEVVVVVERHDDGPRYWEYSYGPRVPILFIVVIVLASLIVIILIVLTVVCVRRRRRKRAAAAVSENDTGAEITASEVARGKQPERANLQSDFAETMEMSGEIPVARGGVGGTDASAGGSGIPTTLMPMEFFAPDPGENKRDSR